MTAISKIAVIPPTAFDPTLLLLLTIAVIILHVIMMIWGSLRLQPISYNTQPQNIRPLPPISQPPKVIPSRQAEEPKPELPNLAERFQKLDEILKNLEERLNTPGETNTAPSYEPTIQVNFQAEMSELLALAEGLKREVAKLAYNRSRRA